MIFLYPYELTKNTFYCLPLYQTRSGDFMLQVKWVTNQTYLLMEHSWPSAVQNIERFQSQVFWSCQQCKPQWQSTISLCNKIKKIKFTLYSYRLWWGWHHDSSTLEIWNSPWPMADVIIKFPGLINHDVSRQLITSINGSFIKCIQN